jgi:uncharacterized membrane protein YhiD involved in acid resistance
MTPHWELAVRMHVGALLGGIIGYERDYHGRSAELLESQPGVRAVKLEAVG